MPLPIARLAVCACAMIMAIAEDRKLGDDDLIKLLATLQDDAQRKRMVMALGRLELITDEQRALAFYAYPLRGA